MTTARYFGYAVSLLTFCWAFWLVYQNPLGSRALVIAIVFYMVLRALLVEALWWVGKDDEHAWVRKVTREPQSPEAGRKRLHGRGLAAGMYLSALFCGLFAFLLSRGSDVRLWSGSPVDAQFDTLAQEAFLGLKIARIYLLSRLLHGFPMAWTQGIGRTHAVNSAPAAVLLLATLVLVLALFIGVLFDAVYSHWWVSGLILAMLSLIDEDWRHEATSG